MNAHRIAACTVVALAALAGACATVPSERDAIDARAAAARTPEQHWAVAAEYEALAQRAMEAAQRFASYAQQDRATADLIDRSRERYDRPAPYFFRPQWELHVQGEVQAAHEMFELARRQRDLAAQAAR